MTWTYEDFRKMIFETIEKNMRLNAQREASEIRRGHAWCIPIVYSTGRRAAIRPMRVKR